MADDKVTSGAERQKAYEGRMREDGYKRMCFWVHETDETAVRNAVNAIIYSGEKTDG